MYVYIYIIYIRIYVYMYLYVYEYIHIQSVPCRPVTVLVTSPPDLYPTLYRKDDSW